MDFSGYLASPEFWVQFSNDEKTVRDGAAERPPLGVAGWSGTVTLSEWAFVDGVRSLLHEQREGADPQVLVRIGDEHPRDGVRILKWYDSTPSVENPHPPFDAALIPEAITEIDVNGTPVLFEVWSGNGVIWAGGMWHGESIVVEARGVGLDEIQLTTVADIEPYLAGRRRLIAAQRGEDPPAPTL